MGVKRSDFQQGARATDDEISGPAGSQLVDEEVGSADHKPKLYPGHWHPAVQRARVRTALTGFNAWLGANCNRDR